MAQKPSYEELEQQIRELRQEKKAVLKVHHPAEDSEGMYRIILENISDAVVITDDYGKIVYVCPNCHIIFGRSQNDLYNLGTVQKLMCGRVCDVSELKNKNDINNIEWSISDKSGTEHFLLVNAKSVNIKDGTVLYVMRDVTERKKAEVTLLTTTQTLSEAQRVAKIGSWQYDPVTQIPLWTDEMFHIFGLEPQPEALSYEEHKKIIHPKDWERFDTAVSRAVTEGVGYDLELRITHPNGEIRNINARCEAGKNESGEVIRLIGTTQDITDRKNAENALLQQKKFLQKAQEIGKIGTWELDIQKNELLWTVENYNIFGISIGSKLTYEIFLDCVHPDDRNYVDAEWKATFSGKPYDITHRLIVDGKTKWVREKAELEFNEKGECIKGTGFTQDITELKQAETSSERAMIQLESLWNITKIADSDIKDISDHVLTEVQKMTQSQYAFYGFLSEDEQEMILHAWSNETMDDCRTDEKTLHFATQKAGIWAEAVRNRKILTINDFTVEHQGKKGVPDGHVPLTRLMTVPLIKDKKVISVVAVANKKENYSNDDEQQVKAFLGNIQILIDRKKAEKALIESEKKWRNILVSTPQIGISLTPRGRIVFANDHFLKITGWKNEDIINQNWFDLFIPDAIREEIREVFHATLIRKKSLDFSTYENEILTKSGGLLSIAWSNVVNKDANGEVLDITCLGVDLTERVRAEKEMAKQKRLFETMFNTIPDGVVITDTERMIQLVNKGMTSTFGYKPEELLGKSTKILYGDQSEYDKTGKTVFSQNAKKQDSLYVKRYKDSNGKEFSGETFGAKLFDESNQWIGNLGIIRDITEREQAEMRLKQAQKMEAIGTLAGGIAHDFNNILFSIVGHTEMLLEDVPADSPLRDSLNEIYTGSLRARDLVQQILAFSRQGKSELKLMKMQPIIKEALKLIRSTIPTTISINQNLQPDCGPVNADPTQIHQIVMNLTTNAYHAMEENGGELKVTLKEIRLNEHELNNPDMTPGSYACLTITDTGMGMDKKVIDKIFNPFFTTKEKGKGTGMGLSVVHGIVKSMDGAITVYSEPGKGTEFYVYLPVIENSTLKEENRTNEPMQGGTERILLIDDEKGIITMEEQALKRLGYQVTSRTSSIKALEAFRANPDEFDLVITDMAMPNMSGNKLAVELIKIRPDIPVLICTGFSESMSEEKIESMGVKGLLLKPIIIKDLAKKIREVLDKKNEI